MTTKKRPSRGSSPDWDFMDRISSSSPEPPEDPLAGVIIGSQSRAAKRGEYVPVPTRTYTVPALQSSRTVTRELSNMMVPSPPRPAPRPKHASKLQPKPPSRTQSRPPVATGKGKAKEALAVIEISDDSDINTSAASPPTFPLHSSRRGNVAPPASTSATMTSWKKRTNTSRNGDFALQAEPSAGRGGEDEVAFVMADEGLTAGSGAAAKRRRVEKPADRDVPAVDTDVGVSMDVDLDVDMDMEVDTGYQSDATLSYVSEDEPEPVPRRPMEIVTGEGLTPVHSDIEDGARDEMVEEGDERPFPDFASLRGATSAKTSAPTSLSSKACTSSSVGAGAHISQSHRERENAVAGPSNSNPASARSTSSSNVSNAVAGPSEYSNSASAADSHFHPSSNTKLKTAPNPNINPNLKLSPHAGLFDNTGMSPEDAAVVYAAMFGEEDKEEAGPRPMLSSPASVPAPVSAPIPEPSPTIVAGVVANANQLPVMDSTEKGKRKARAGPGPVIGLVREPQAPLCALNTSEMPADRSTKEQGNGNAQGAGKEKEKARALEPATMEEHFLRALRAATAIQGDFKGKGKAREDEDEEEVPLYVEYMRRAARAFEEAWSDATVEEGLNGKEKEKGEEKKAAVAAAQNAFTFSFPRGAGAPAVPPPGRQEKPRQYQQAQQPMVQPVRDPWSFMFAPPMSHEPQPAPLNHAEPEAAAAPVPPVPLPSHPFPFVAAPGMGAADMVQPQHPPAVVAPVPAPAAVVALRPDAFTFAFPRGAAGPTAAGLHGAQAQAIVPGPAVIAISRPAHGPTHPPHVQAQQVQQPKPVLPPPVLAPPAGPSLFMRQGVPGPMPIQTPPVEVVAPPPPGAVAAFPPSPQPAPVAAPAPAPVLGLAPAPILTREQLTERAIAQITEILPDVEPGYLLAHVSTYVDALGDRTAEHVLGILFEAEASGGDGYPRVVRKRVVPPPAQPQPASAERAPVKPQVQVPQPQPVAGGSTLGVRARAGEGQARGGQQGVTEPEKKKVKTDDIVNYEDANRRSPSEAYCRLSLYYLRLAFPYLPKHIVTAAMYQHNNLYAPTYVHLLAAEQRYTAFPVREERPYRCNSTKYNACPERRVLARVWDEVFGEEWLWMEERQGRVQKVCAPLTYARLRASHGAPPEAASERRAVGHDPQPGPVAGPARVQAQAQVAVPPPPAPPAAVPPVVDNVKGKQRAIDVKMAPPTEEEPVEGEGDIECGCCFSECTFDKMVQCPEAHLFCSDCVSQYAATQLGQHNTSIVCMHSSGCKLPFRESELRRVLTPTLMALYSRLIAHREVAAAGLEGLEDCPFCDWQCVIDVPIEMDRLFRCGNEEEMEEDQVLDGQHAIEEAMTRALMRNCPNPNCKKAFVKETGCNKMLCPNCRTLSCYVCRQIIKGYDHFDVMPGAPANTAIAGRCKLWENVNERHANEVRAAAERAAEDLRRANPEIDHEAIRVDIPVAPPLAPAAAAAGHRVVPALVANPRQALLQQQAAQLRLQQEVHRQRVLEEARRQQELRAEIVRQERERKAELRRQRKQREREAQEHRVQEARRIRLQQQQELHPAAVAAASNAERLAAINSDPFGGPTRALPPVVRPAGPHAPGFPQGVDLNNRGQREQ